MVIFMSLPPTFQVFVIHFSCALLYLFCVVDISIDYAFKQQQAVRNVLNSEQRVRGVWVTHTHIHIHRLKRTTAITLILEMMIIALMSLQHQLTFSYQTQCFM